MPNQKFNLYKFVFGQEIHYKYFYFNELTKKMLIKKRDLNDKGVKDIQRDQGTTK